MLTSPNKTFESLFDPIKKPRFKRYDHESPHTEIGSRPTGRAVRFGLRNGAARGHGIRKSDTGTRVPDPTSPPIQKEKVRTQHADDRTPELDQQGRGPEIQV
ncbi:hypothetical protein NL676_036413 [Syzygium grande]|nr:hypothetical protein NL676_036413 [Syzygium grande]